MKLSFFVFTFFIVCWSYSQSHAVVDTKVNSKYNRKYVKSIKNFEGKLPENEYVNLRLAIQTELKTSIPDNFNILIHYEQRASNCIGKRVYKQDYLSRSIKNRITENNRLRQSLGTIQFFVYKSDSFFSETFKNHPEYILDSGYFEKNIFTLSENCSAFFILKTSGEFIIRYGEDHMSEVYNFFKKKNNEPKN